MVILQFNKLIRNKWVWGVFAIVVSLAFVAPDDWFRDDNAPARTKSHLEDMSVKYDAKLEKDCRDILELFPENPDARNRGATRSIEVAENYAAMASFDEAGIRVSDNVLAQAIRSRYLSAFAYDEAQYAQRIQQQYGMGIGRFEELLRKSMQTQQGISAYMNATAWVSTMETEQIVHDLTDRLTVRVATFTQTKEESDAINLDDEGLKKWYDENGDRLHVPTRLKLRTVLFNVADTNLVASIEVTPEEITARYEQDKDSLYSTTDTNGVITVKAEAEVKDEIVKTLTREKFLEKYENGEIASRANEENALISDDPETPRASILDDIAKASGLRVAMTGWIEVKPSEGLVPGFARTASAAFPGASDVQSQISALDPASDSYYRYGIFAARNSGKVWLVETAETSPAHDATFEECKELIRTPALRDARQKAFEDAVAAVTKKGVDAVLATTNVSEAVTFSASDEEAPKFDNARRVIPAAIQLNKGEMSDFISTGTGRGIVVVCMDRTDGELAMLGTSDREALAQVLRSREFALPELAAADRLSYVKYTVKRDQWLKSNLKRLGYKDLDSSAEDQD